MGLPLFLKSMATYEVYCLILIESTNCTYRLFSANSAQGIICRKHGSDMRNNYFRQRSPFESGLCTVFNETPLKSVKNRTPILGSKFPQYESNGKRLFSCCFIICFVFWFVWNIKFLDRKNLIKLNRNKAEEDVVLSASENKSVFHRTTFTFLHPFSLLKYDDTDKLKHTKAKVLCFCLKQKINNKI
uniref:Uncharacterized protein n=1 Tax=Heterorhabditis bacteriophora TaxID=37862 RepID=A0A1I7X2C4_HETBA